MNSEEAENVDRNNQSMNQQDYDDEIARLNKLNFNLKLRIFYLEERVGKIRRGTDSESALLQENFDQKLLLEERLQEIEERNVTLGKARNAIETLQADIKLVTHELNMTRANYVDPAILEEKDNEISALKAKNKSLMETDKIRLEDINKVNTQMRQLQENLDKRWQELQETNLFNSKLQYEMKTTSEENELLKDTIENLNKEVQVKNVVEKKLITKSKEFEELERSFKQSKAQLVDNAETIGKLRTREAALMRQNEEVALIESTEIQKVKKLLRNKEHEADKLIKSDAFKERDIEQLQKRVRQLNDALEEYEMREELYKKENESILSKYRNREAELANQATLLQLGMRRELTEVEADLRQQLATAKGASEALAHSRDEAYKKLAAQQLQTQKIEQKLAAIQDETHLQLSKAEKTTADYYLQVAEHRQQVAKLEAKYDSDTGALRAEWAARYEAEAEARVAAEKELQHLQAKLVEREAAYRHQIHKWEANIASKFDEYVPISNLRAIQEPLMENAALSNELSNSLMVEFERMLAEEGDSNAARVNTDGEITSKKVLHKLKRLHLIKTFFHSIVNQLDSRWTAQFHQLQKELDRKQRSLVNAERLLNQLAMNMERIKQKKANSFDHIRSSYEQHQQQLLTDFKYEREQYHSKVTSIEKRAMEADSKKEMLLTQLSQAEMKNKELQHCVMDMKERYNALTGKLDEAIAVRHEFEKQIDSMDSKLTLLNNKYEDRGAELEAARIHNNNASLQINKLKKQCEQLRRLKDNSEARLRAVENQVNLSLKQAVHGSDSVVVADNDALLRQLKASDELIHPNDAKQQVLVDFHQSKQELKQLSIQIDRSVLQAKDCLHHFLHSSGGSLASSVRQQLHQLMSNNVNLSLQVNEIVMDLKNVYKRFKQLEQSQTSTSPVPAPPKPKSQARSLDLLASNSSILNDNPIFESLLNINNDIQGYLSYQNGE